MSLICRNPSRDIPRLLWPHNKQEPIHKLIVDRQELEERDARVLSMALSSRDNALKVLYLYKNKISAQSLCTILLGLSSSLGALRQLQSCLLTNPNHSSGSLESLYICATPMPFSVVQLLSSVLRLNDTLKELYLWDNQLEEISIVHLSVNGLAANRTLTKLVITRNANMTGTAAAAVLSAFGRNESDETAKEYRIQQLRVLHLSHNQLNADDMQLLVPPLSNITLAKLCLDGNAFGDNGARALAGALSHNPMIQRLDLVRTHIGSTGARALARHGLANNSHLRHLVLTDNGSVHRRGLQALLEVLQQSNQTIHSIQLPRTKETMLRCQIEYYLSLNRAGRQHVSADPNLNWGLWSWILAGKEASVVYFFLSHKPEFCQRL